MNIGSNIIKLNDDFQLLYGANIQPTPNDSPVRTNTTTDAPPAQQQQPNHDAPANSARAIHAELHDLLRNISRETYHATTASDIRNLIGDFDSKFAKLNDAKFASRMNRLDESKSTHDKVLLSLANVLRTAKVAQAALASASTVKARDLLTELRGETGKTDDSSVPLKDFLEVDPKELNDKLNGLSACDKIALAAEAQSEISDQLLKLFNKYADILPDNFRATLADLAETCDCRSSELSTLTLQMAALADEINAADNSNEQAIIEKKFNVVLDRSVDDLAKDMGGAMHGNLDIIENGAGGKNVIDAITKIKLTPEHEKIANDTLLQLEDSLKDISAKLGPSQNPVSPLAERMNQRVRERFTEEINAMATRLHTRGKIVAWQMRIGVASEYRPPIRDLDLAFKGTPLHKKYHNLFKGTKLSRKFANALHAYAETGSEKSRQRVEKKGAALAAFAEEFSAIHKLAQYMRDLIALTSEKHSQMQSHVVQELSDALRDDNIESELTHYSDTLDKWDRTKRNINIRRDELNIMQMARSGNPKEVKEELKKLEKQFDELDRSLNGSIRKFKEFMSNRLGIATTFSQSHLDVTLARIDAFPPGGKNAGRNPPAFHPSDVINVLRGNGSVSDLLKLDMNGIDIDTDADHELADQNLVSQNALGGGSANSVQKLEYKDGRKVVFKSERSGAIGLRNIMLGVECYEHTQQAAKLNLAAKYGAHLLGCDKRIVNTRAMYHNGEYGIGMDFVDGVHPSTINQKFIDGESPDDICEAIENEDRPDVRKKMLGQYGQAINDIFEQETDLQWCDLMSGQGDRHSNNYFVHVNPDTFEANVVGIDNDQCFPSYRPGLTRLRVEGSHLQHFMYTLKNTSRLSTSGSSSKLLEQAIKDLNIQKNERGEKYFEIDLSNRNIPSEILHALHWAFGIKSFAPPPFMSANMYNHLMELDKDEGKLLQAIQNFGNYMPLENVIMAGRRLRETIALAKEYKAKGLIIDSRKTNDPSSLPWLDKKVIAKLRPIDFNSKDPQAPLYPCLFELSDDDRKIYDEAAYKLNGSIVTRDLKSLFPIIDLINADREN